MARKLESDHVREAFEALGWKYEQGAGGHSAYVLTDPEHEQVFLATDVGGVAPLFWNQHVVVTLEEPDRDPREVFHGMCTQLLDTLRNEEDLAHDVCVACGLTARIGDPCPGCGLTIGKA